MIKYIELKSDFSDCGPAWIANIKKSRSGSTIYFNQMALKKGHGVSGNYFNFSNGNGWCIKPVVLLNHDALRTSAHPIEFHIL